MMMLDHNNNNNNNNKDTPPASPISASLATSTSSSSVSIRINNNSNNNEQASSLTNKQSGGGGGGGGESLIDSASDLLNVMVHKAITSVKVLPIFVKAYLVATIVIHLLQYIPLFHTFAKDYLLYQPALLFTNYRLYTPVTSMLLNSNIAMLLINSCGIVFAFSFTAQNNFLSDSKLISFLMWNALFGAIGATISWSLAWHLTLNENLLTASFPGATALLNAMNLLLAHFSPESPLPIHRKLRIRHLPGLYLLFLVPFTFLFVSWEDSVLCFTGLIGGWVVIRFIWQEKREQWRFTQVFVPEQLRSLFGSRSIALDLDFDLLDSQSVQLDNHGGANAQSKSAPTSPPAVTVIPTHVSNKRLIGEQALMEKLRRKESEQKQSKGTTAENRE